MNRKSIGCTVERTRALGVHRSRQLQGLPSNLVGHNRGTAESFGSQGYKVNTMVFWTAWCMASGSCSFPRVRKNQASLLKNQDPPFSVRRSNFRAIRAHRDPTPFHDSLYTCNIDELCRWRPEARLHWHVRGGATTHSCNVFQKRSSNVGSASSSGEYATMTFSCSSQFPGKPRQRTPQDDLEEA